MSEENTDMGMSSCALRRTATALATFGLVAGGTVATAGTARASEGDGNCRSGDVCLYWASDLRGAMATFYYNQASHYQYKFPANGSGRGQEVANNVMSTYNNARLSGVTIYTRTYFRGSRQYLGPGKAANLNWSVRNNNESHRFRFFG